MNSIFSLNDRVAVVTGGNGGIGKGIASGLASMGCDIVIAARNRAKTESAVHEIEGKFGVRVLGFHLDLRDEDRIEALFDQAPTGLGRIDILVNNAGINIRKLPHELTASEWDDVLDPCRTLGPPIGHGRGRRVPGKPRLGFRDGCRPSRGRRLFRDALKVYKTAR